MLQTRAFNDLSVSPILDASHGSHGMQHTDTIAPSFKILSFVLPITDVGCQ